MKEIKKSELAMIISAMLIGLGILVVINISWSMDIEHDFCLNHYSIGISNSTDTRYFIEDDKCCAFVRRYSSEGSCFPFEKVIWGSCSGKFYGEKVCVEIVEEP